MKNLLFIFFLASTILFSGCQEDDYEEIIGVCPVVLFTDPGNGSIAVPLGKVIAITFNTDMRPSTINDSTIYLVQGADTISGTFSVTDSIVYFAPSSFLTPFASYTGTITTGVKDITGNALQQPYVWSFATGAAGVDIGGIARFGILSSTGISSTGFSEIANADIGVSPGLRSSITGFPPAQVINGLMMASDDQFPAGIPAMLALAKDQLTAAYLFAENVTSPTVTIVEGDLGGRTLQPGIFKSLGGLMIESGHLTLDAGGDVNAYWIFQIASDLVTQGGSGGDVLLTGGAKATNVYWQTGGSTILGTNTSFKGTILGLTTIRMNADATIEGRLLSRNGSVILGNTNFINKPQI